MKTNTEDSKVSLSLSGKEKAELENQGCLWKKMKPKDASFFLRKRYYVILMALISRILMVVLKTNMSLCLVDMTTSKRLAKDNVTYVKEAEFNWSSIEIGIILSSFSCGHFFAPVGGLLSSRFGGARVFGAALLLTGILRILSPLLIRLHLIVYLISSFVEGLLQGISYASEGAILFHWALPDERTILSNIVFAGAPAGSVISYPVTGYLIYIFSWEAAFYITGGFSIIWSIIWTYLVKDSPAQDTFISVAEKNYYKEINSIKPRKKLDLPWRSMLKSVPLWTLLNERFVASWSSSFMTVCIPLFIKDTYDTNVKSIGWFSSGPHFFHIFGKLPAALLADYLRRNNIYSKTKIHKIFILYAQTGAIISLFAAAIIHNFLINLGLFCSFKLFFSVAYVSYCVLPLDMGAHHSGFIFGLSSMANSLGSVLNPLAIGLIVQNHTYAEWSTYFFLLCALNTWATGLFAFCGSGELQPWADPDYCENKNENVDSQDSDELEKHTTLSQP